MNFFTTGNQTVDELGQLNISGNITPQIWYKTILTEAGKPYYLAISILSDIVYWYRPTEVRDEASGHVVGWKKRFRDDLLQRNYEKFAEMYGESKKTIVRAIVTLENMGIIKRVFRTIELQGGIVLNNVLYIDLDVSALYAITYPEKTDVDKFGERVSTEMPIPMDKTDERVSTEMSIPTDKTDERVWTNATTPMDKSGERVWTNVTTPMDKSGERVWTDVSSPMDKIGESLPTDLSTPLPTNVQTNTKITTEISSENSINQSVTRQDSDSMDEIEAYMQYLKENMEYDVLISNASLSDRRMIDEMLDLMLETMVVKREYIRIGAADYPYALVKSRLMKVDCGCIQYVLKCMKENTTKVRNIKAYLITALYNAPGTIDNYYQAEYNHDRDNGGI